MSRAPTPTRMSTSSEPRCTVTRREGLLALSLFVLPVPASRPRVTRWGTYYSKTYKAYKAAADKAIPRSDAPPLDGNLYVRVKFVCPRPKTTKRLNPKGDIDNHMKAIFDAITGTKKNPKGYWHDDDQIVAVDATKRFAADDEESHTYIEIRRA